MKQVQLGAVEARFADLIWQNAPLPSSELVRLSQQTLQWKKSTTYTVLKRLCDKGLFTTENGVVQVKVTKDAFYSAQSERFVDETFSGSLPAFLAAFTSRKKLTKQEADALRKMIDDFEEEAP